MNISLPFDEFFFKISTILLNNLDFKLQVALFKKVSSYRMSQQVPEKGFPKTSKNHKTLKKCENLYLFVIVFVGLYPGESTQGDG